MSRHSCASSLADKQDLSEATLRGSCVSQLCLHPCGPGPAPPILAVNFHFSLAPQPCGSYQNSHSPDNADDLAGRRTHAHPPRCTLALRGRGRDEQPGGARLSRPAEGPKCEPSRRCLGQGAEREEQELGALFCGGGLCPQGSFSMQSPWLPELKRGAGWLTEGGGLRPWGLGPWSRPLTLLPAGTPLVPGRLRD